MIGRTISHYEVLEKLGEGGMGVVYKARDTRLKRFVALKVLPPEMVADAERKHRFVQEARSASALNHPNIVTVHDIDQSEGVDFIAMEYVEGQALGELIGRNGLKLDDALKYGVQIADALARAHAAGIVHRDIKPANIMVTGDGRAKVLDFGLAKLTEPLPAGPAGSVLSEHPSTETGLIVGTVSYMSPEQAEGKKLDARSDIFSFGSLLYEMLTGRRAFRRDSPALTLAAILHLEPPSLPAGLPRDVERVIARCLRKDPARRFQHMDDVRVWLEDLKQDSKPDLERAMLGAREPAGATAVGRWYPLGLSIAAGLLLIAATVLGYLAFRRAPEVARPIRFTIIAPENTTLYEPRVSPDSERIIFDVAITDGKRQVYVRRLDSPELTAVPGTEGASDSFWSPDSRSIGFYVDGRLMRVDLAGGQPQTLCTGLTDVTYGDWNRDDVILLGGKGRGLVRVPAQGGAPVAVTVLDPRKRELAHIAPVFLPDGKRFVYLARQAEGQLSAKWGSLDGKESGELPFRSAWLQYAPPSYLLFPRDGAVFAQQLDLKNMKLTGAPWIAGGPVREFADQIYQFSASGNGVLAWTTAATRTASELVWFDASGRRGGTVGPPAEYGSPALAPDGRRLAVDIYDPAAKTRDIWILDPNRGSRTRFTFDPADDFSPVWSPDGSRIAWTSDRRGVRDLYVKPASGTGQDEPLLVSPLPKQADDWSRDGGYLVYNQPVEGGPAFSIFALPLSPGAERKPLPVFGREFAERQGRLSPDSRLLAYMSNESSRQSQVFVQPFPPTGARWQVSPSGGNEPRWRADGKELYYLSGNKLMAADVKTDGVGFEAGVPRTLFEARFVSFLGRRNRYAIARDGRFLLNVMPEQTPIERSSITVLVNWQAAPGK